MSQLPKILPDNSEVRILDNSFDSPMLFAKLHRAIMPHYMNMIIVRGEVDKVDALDAFAEAYNTFLEPNSITYVLVKGEELLGVVVLNECTSLHRNLFYSTYVNINLGSKYYVSFWKAIIEDIKSKRIPCLETIKYVKPNQYLSTYKDFIYED